MSSISVKFDTVKYRNDLNQFVERLNADSVLLLKEEMRLLLRDIQTLTAPKTLAQGRKAVKGDLRRVAAPLDAERIQMPALKQAVAKRDLDAIAAISKNLKGTFFANRKLLSSEGEIQAAHLTARNNRGRVRRDLGNMAILRTWNKYAKSVMDRVGYTRSGWFAAAQGAGLKLPSWVSKHAAYARGGYVAPTPASVEIVAVNRSSKVPEYQRTVDAAMKLRAKSLGLELKRLMDGGKSRRASLAGTSYGEAAS